VLISRPFKKLRPRPRPWCQGLQTKTFTPWSWDWDRFNRDAVWGGGSGGPKIPYLWEMDLRSVTYKDSVILPRFSKYLSISCWMLDSTTSTSLV